MSVEAPEASAVEPDPESASSAPTRREFPIGRWLFYGGAVLAAVFMVRILGANWRSNWPAGWPDAVNSGEGYLWVAGRSPFRPSFYFEYRPIGYPFFLWLFGRSTSLVVIAQTALYVAAVYSVCWAAWDNLRSRALSLVTIALILLFAMQAKFAFWTTQILSESLSISLGLLAIAFWWRFAVEPKFWRGAWGWFFVVWWMVERDAHVLAATAVIVPVALLVAWRAKQSLDLSLRKLLAVGALICLGATGYSYLAESVSNRGLLSFHHTVGLRILTNPEIREWFEDRGMPQDEGTDSRTNKSGFDDELWLNFDDDPRYAEYAEWVEGSGRRDLVFSMFFLAPTYQDMWWEDLPRVLKGDLSYYDGHKVYDRMPREVPLQLGGPTTRAGLGVWLLVAGTATAAASILLFGTRQRRRWGPIIFGLTGLALPLLEMYSIWVGDPIEMERHMIGAVSRLCVMLIVLTAIGADVIISALRGDLERIPAPVVAAKGEATGEDADVDLEPDLEPAPEPTPQPDPTPRAQRERRRPIRSIVLWLTTFAISVVGFVAIIGNNGRAAQQDAVFSHGLVNRALRYGGSYYENGIHPKGPLEEVAHDIARRVGGYDGHWYVLSALIAVSALIIGFAAARTALATGGNKWVGLGVGAAVFIHFAVGAYPYSGILYSRNITVTLLALGWLVAIEDTLWTNPRRQLYAAIALGVFLGLAAQTTLPSLFAAGVIGLTGLALATKRITTADQRRKILMIATLSGALGLLSAPIWYVLRGSFAEFWASWWDYARFQPDGVGLSLGEQFGRGWDEFYKYYQQTPLLFFMNLALVAVTVFMWERLSYKSRVLHIGALAWLVGAWLELILGARYSGHYFAALATPQAIIAALLAGHAWRAISTQPRVARAAIAIPLVVIVFSFVLSHKSGQELINQAEITSEFTSTQRIRDEDAKGRNGQDRSIQAVLDLVSDDLDPLLTWDNNPYVYPYYRRIPATRFPQYYFVIGAIYLGRTSEEYILDGTEGWYRGDVAESNPAIFMPTDEVSEPWVADFIDENFTTVFQNSKVPLLMRDDLYEEIVNGRARDQWSPTFAPAGDQGWKVDGDAAQFTTGVRPLPDDKLMITDQRCRRIDGTITSSTDDAPALVFQFVDGTDRTQKIRLKVENGLVAAQDPNGFVFDEIPATGADGNEFDFSLIIGAEQAVLIVDDTIVGAVQIPETGWVDVEPLKDGVGFDNMRVGEAPKITC